jgi:hypothetical protein
MPTHGWIATLVARSVAVKRTRLLLAGQRDSADVSPGCEGFKSAAAFLWLGSGGLGAGGRGFEPGHLNSRRKQPGLSGTQANSQVPGPRAGIIAPARLLTAVAAGWWLDPVE